MHLDWSLGHVAGVALVALRLRSSAPLARVVRVENRLDGPVLPPRRRGVAEPGWDETGVECLVGAGETVALGYAVPGADEEGADPPAEVVDVRRPDGDGEDASRGGNSAVREGPTPVQRALLELGDARPPRGAVPTDSFEHERGEVDEADEGNDADETDRSPPVTSEETGTRHAAVDDWLDGVERRLALAERLEGASLAEATALLRDARDAEGADATGSDDGGTGLDAAAALAEAVAADAERLEGLAERSTALASRARSVRVPVDALRRLA